MRRIKQYRVFLPQPPTYCSSISPSSLRAGDCLLLHSEYWLAYAVQSLTDSPWSHATMVIEDPITGALYVGDMVWPKLQVVPLEKWLAQYPDAWVYQIKDTLSTSQKNIIWNWWNSHIGAWYDVGLLFQMAPLKLWQKIAQWLHFPISWQKLKPLVSTGVCATCCGWAWKRAGLPVDSPRTLAPADMPRQIFLIPSISKIL